MRSRSQPLRRFGPDCIADGWLDPAFDPRRELIQSAEAATTVLVESNRLSNLDMVGIQRGLEMAKDSYRRLERMSGGATLGPEVQKAFEALLRATLETYPVILHAQLDRKP